MYCTARGNPTGFFCIDIPRFSGSIRAMKHLLRAIAVLTCLTAFAAAQTTLPVLEPGFYQGTIVVTHTIPSLKLSEVTTLPINAEVYMRPPNGNGGLPLPTITWTPRSSDLAAKLTNVFGWIQIWGDTTPETISDMQMTGTTIKIYGGTVVPKSYKRTTRSVSWKCTKDVIVTHDGNRTTTYVTSFSIKRIGPAPIPYTLPTY
jgi:hypothetical protein